MKEYMVLAKAKIDGKWYKPLIHNNCIRRTKEDAQKLLEFASQFEDSKKRFDAFKIVERDVSEWKDSEVTI